MTTEEMAKSVHVLIQIEIGNVLCCGLQPKRIYMNRETWNRMFRYCMEFIKQVEVFDGVKVSESIYGVPIAISEDLEDGEIDVSIKR